MYFKNSIIHKPPEESGICQGGAVNLSQAMPALKQINLNKLSGGSGSQIQWPPTQAETDSSGSLCIYWFRFKILFDFGFGAPELRPPKQNGCEAAYVRCRRL